MDTSTLIPLLAGNNNSGSSAGMGAAAGAGIGLGVGALGALMLSEGIGNKTLALNTAIADGFAASIAADQSAHLANMDTTNRVGMEVSKTVSDSNIAGINATNLSGVSVIKQVTDNAVAINKAISDSALSNALSAAEIRELISTTANSNLIATKDAYASVLLQFEKGKNETDREILKGFAATQYKALEDKAELQRQISECCCEMKTESDRTRALILSENSKRLETEVADLRMKVLLSKISPTVAASVAA